MRKFPIIFRLIGWLFLSLWIAVGCGGESSQPRPQDNQLTTASHSLEKLGQTWFLGLGQSIRLLSGDILTFTKVHEDSRCPIDVFCFWEGRIVLEFLHRTEQDSKLIYLGIGRNTQKAVSLDGSVTLRLEEVTPEPVSTQPESKRTYQAQLRLYDVHQNQPDLAAQLEGVRLTSLYDQRLGVIELEFLNGRPFLFRDRNRCRLDRFGEPAGCTKMAILRTEVEMVLDASEGESKYRYRIEGVEGYYFVADYTYDHPTYRLLVYEDAENQSSPIVKAMTPVQKVKIISSDL